MIIADFKEQGEISIEVHIEIQVLPAAITGGSLAVGNNGGLTDGFVLKTAGISGAMVTAGFMNLAAVELPLAANELPPAKDIAHCSAADEFPPLTSSLQFGFIFSEICNTNKSFVFALFMDVLTRHFEEDVPWCLLIAHHILLVDKIREGVQVELDF
ncbi:hypothetical protein IEQ34_011517 [Dendrobium chrysotoxum]|uniref:Uncharacterized protein n=1 Tax=Dendrobium chrysotoxum TaxID=161865 RepID=A0AAV7GSV9_DENCH|nr:hypothetical protein IEQ34_011517 [Dendrobium chrysotoxum]